MVLQIYNKNFSKKLYSKDIVGNFSNLCKADNRLIFTSYDKIKQKTYIHTLNLDLGFTINTKTILKYSATVLPIVCNNKLLFCVQQKVDEINKGQVINLLYCENDSGTQFTKLYKFDQQPVCALSVDNDNIYFLLGKNSCILSNYKMKNSIMSTVTSFGSEGALGLYQLSNKPVIITSGAIYLLQDKKVLKQNSFKSDLYNQYS